jgi:Flp pilus assembly pilin Flp
LKAAAAGRQPMKTFLSRFSKNKSGVTIGEYVLIAALIWVVIMIGVRVISAGKSSGGFNIAQRELR